MTKLYISQYGPKDPKNNNKSYSSITADHTKACMSIDIDGGVDEKYWNKGGWLYLDESARDIWIGETKIESDLVFGYAYPKIEE